MLQDTATVWAKRKHWLVIVGPRRRRLKAAKHVLRVGSLDVVERRLVPPEVLVARRKLHSTMVPASPMTMYVPEE